MIKNKVFNNAAWIIVCRIIQAILNLVVTMFTARFLGPVSLGVIQYAASLIAFVVPIMQLGLNSVLVRELVKNPQKEGEIMGTSTVMCLFSALLSLAGVVAFTMVANASEPETILVCALYGICLLFQALEMMQYWFQAKYLSKYTSIVMLISYVCVTVYKIVLLIQRMSVYWFAVSYAIDYAIIAIALLCLYKRLGGQRLSFSLKRAKELFSAGKYYIISAMMVILFTQTDKIMIKFMMGSEFVGYYSAATACCGVTAFVFAALIDSFRPTVFENRRLSVESYENSLKLLYALIIFLALAQSILMTVAAELIIHVLYGEAYYAAITTLQIAVWYTTFSYIGAVRDVWIVAERKEKYLWIINLSGALSNIALNACLIPLWGINGAALATLLTQSFTNVLLGFIIKPIRRNNFIMFSALSPRAFVSSVKSFLKK